MNWTALNSQLASDRAAVINDLNLVWGDSIPELEAAVNDASSELEFEFQQKLQEKLDHLTDKLEKEKKSAWLGRNEIMEKLIVWSHIEVGDTVKAKAQGESLWYDATILQVNDGPLYTIRWHGFDDDDPVCSSADDNLTGDDGSSQCETDVHPSRIRKIQSKRHQLLRERWHSTKRLTAPLAAFREASVND